jgi:hypothetical protein
MTPGQTKGPTLQAMVSPGNNKRQFRASQKGKHRKGGNAKAGKELTKKLKLSKEDHDHAVANMLCFGCKKPGHFANDCPDSKTVAGGSGNKPPGKVSSYSVRIAPDIKTLRELADTTETIDHLELGSCELMIESFMVDEPDYRRQRMGDPLARRVEHVLAMSALYPGDNTMDLGTYPRVRFSVFQGTSTHHIIWDREKFEEDRGTIIHSHQLEDRSFRIGKWYAQEMA